MARFNKTYKQNTNEIKNTISKEDAALARFAEMLIEKIETIKDDWQKPWFTAGTISWPVNMSGRDYNGMNTFMLSLLCEEKGYKVPVFATANAIDALNYKKTGEKREAMTDKNGEKLPLVHINKGEKSFPVFITTFTVIHTDGSKISYDDYRNMEDEDKKAYNVFPKMHVYNVFNLEQTNIKEARPEIWEKWLNKKGNQEPTGKDQQDTFTFPAFDDMVANQNWLCPINIKHQDCACYSPSADEITLPEKSQFKDGESFYGTAFHEMIHSTGIESRLNREMGGGFGSHTYAKEELVAEMGAALTASRYGMSKTIDKDSVPYIKSWLKGLKEDPKFIWRLLLDVKHASYEITKRLDTIE